MRDAWIEGGGTFATYQKRLSGRKPLSDYHCNLIEQAGVKLDGNERFFENAAALLGMQMDQVLAEAKGDAIEGDQGDNPTKRLIFRLMKALRKG